jgi:hypothetical protein
MTVETSDQAETRLLNVIANARFEVLAEVYAFAELPQGNAPKPSALACVRDGDVWSQLIPASATGATEGLFKLVSFHFKEGLDASGFVGWLASHLKRTVGTGVIVICGKDGRSDVDLYAASHGVFDYWGCPARLGDAVIGEIQSLIARGRREPVSALRSH